MNISSLGEARQNLYTLNNINDAIDDLKGIVIANENNFYIIAKKQSDSIYLIELEHYAESGIPANGIQLPYSIKPIFQFTFSSKAFVDNVNRWYQGFLIQPNGMIYARSTEDNANIAVEYTSIHVVFLGTAEFS